MSPGEETIYEYILEVSARYACLNVQVNITEIILTQYAEKESEKIKSLEPKFWQMLEKEIGVSPLIKRYCNTKPKGKITVHKIRFSPFDVVLNDIWNGIQYQTCSQGWYDTDPLRGKGVIITYDMIQENLGISKDVAKDCIERLMERGKIKRRRAMGGFEYTADAFPIHKKMVENPGEWKPQHFNPERGCYEEDESLWPVINAAQEGLQCFQEYYEQRVKEDLKTEEKTG